MKRGEIWTSAGGAPFTGKPRPALILQADLFAATLSVTICGLTSDLTPTPFLRPLLLPSSTTGLRQTSRVMVDKITSVSRTRLGKRLGSVAPDDLAQVELAMLVFLGFAT